MTAEQKKPDMNKISDIIAAAERDSKFENISINPDLRDLLDVLTAEERKQLEDSILTDGLREPIMLWDETGDIIDGHNRYDIVTQYNLDMPQPIRRSFPDLSAVKNWMIRNQLGRRNLSKQRFEYYIGQLYINVKQTSASKTPNPEGKTTAAVIAEQTGVSERTVRRAAEVAVGIDKIAQVKGKIEKANLLGGKSDYTREEVTAVGKTTNAAVAKAALAKIDANKAAAKQVATTAKKTQAAVKAAPKNYSVVFAKPDFGASTYSEANVVKPNLDKEAIVYMYVPDEYLMRAMQLVKRWGLDYEATFVYATSKAYDGVYSKIKHIFMIVSTKGTMPGPKAGKEADSFCYINGDDPIPAMFKMMNGYHPEGKRQDMRSKPENGWDGLPR